MTTVLTHRSCSSAAAFWLLLVSLFSLLSFGISLSTTTTTPNTAITSSSSWNKLQVCCSPGCLADGAVATLAKLQALAPPYLTIEPGNCHSYCGQGPVVTNVASFYINLRVVADAPTNSDDKLLELLCQASKKQEEASNDVDNNDKQNDSIPIELIQGYELVQQGHEALEQKRYADAITFYEQGISIAADMALERKAQRDQLILHQQQQQQARVKGRSALSFFESNSVSLVLWLVAARCGQAQACLAIKDASGALNAAVSAWEWSSQTHGPALELLIQTYQVLKRKEDELDSIERFLTLISSTLSSSSSPAAALTTNGMLITRQQQQKERDRVAMVTRELGFRKAKLQRELNNIINKKPTL